MKIIFYTLLFLRICEHSLCAAMNPENNPSPPLNESNNNSLYSNDPKDFIRNLSVLGVIIESQSTFASSDIMKIITNLTHNSLGFDLTKESDDAVSGIAEALKSCTWIKSFELKAKPEHMSLILDAMPWLETLTISGTYLSKIQHSLERLKDLKTLNLNSHTTIFLPEFLFDMPHLKGINAQENSISFLSGRIQNRPDLTVNLSQNPLYQKGFTTQSGQQFLGLDELSKLKDLNGNPQIILNNMIPFSIEEFFEQKISIFNTILSSDLLGTGQKDRHAQAIKTVPYALGSVIYNTDHYSIYDNNKMPQDGTLFQNVPYYKGESVTLKKGTPVVVDGTLVQNNSPITADIPIDYAIYLPPDDVPIQAVAVKAYGGGYSSLAPHLTRRIEQILLSQGIALIQLNLVDMSAENKTTHQTCLSNDVQAQIHGSIHAFWQILDEHPTSLSEDPRIQELLKRLEHQKIFLIGTSFGGRTAIRHAEFYPNTFDGYISHDGSLDVAFLGSNIFTNNNNDLFVMQDIQNIQDPVLILQNFDDNQVYHKNALNFTKKARALGKDVTFLMTQHGNQRDPKFNHWYYKGHFEPTDPDTLHSYTSHIMSFITGKSDLSHRNTLSDWRVADHQLYAGKESYLWEKNPEKQFKKLFFSLAYRLYTHRAYTDPARREHMKTKTNPLWDMFDNPQITESTLYDGLRYMKQLESDDVIKKGFLSALKNKPFDGFKAEIYHFYPGFLALFREFLMEDNLIYQDPQCDALLSLFEEDTFLNTVIRKEIENNSLFSEGPNLILLFYIISNPQLYEDFSQRIAENDAQQREKNAMIQTFDRKVHNVRSHIRKTWQSAIQLAADKAKQNNNNQVLE